MDGQMSEGTCPFCCQEDTMKKGEKIEGIIEGVNFPNKAYFTAEGRKITVKHGIPGQRVLVGLQKVRKDRGEGRILEVLEPSALEIESPCAHFGECGGCTYQTLPYEEQLKMKEKQVKDLLDQVVPEYVFEGIIGSPRQFGYRNKMEFSFGDEYKDGPLALGMHKRGGYYDIVTVGQCRIVDEDFRQVLSCVLAWAKTAGLPYYHKLSHVGYLRHLLVRKGAKTGEVLVALVTSSQLDGETEAPALAGLTKALLALKLEGKITGILHTVNDSLADVVQSDRTELLWGQEFIDEELLGLRFKITPFSFFQTNSLGAEVLYQKARTYIGETRDKVIFDLYSGTGTIAQVLAPVAAHVVGVEIVEEAVEAAKLNAKLNGLDNCTFLAGDVLKVIDTIQEKPDLIVLDPPRDGINPRALERIIRFGVERMVYISCKPTSLARDLEVLQARGYRVEKVCCIDLFPGTYHVETICCLTRIK